MATYTITGFASYEYRTTDGVNVFGGTTPASVVLDDQEGDMTWEAGDTVFNHGNPPTNDYFGKIHVGLVGGGTQELAVITGRATYVDPNVIQLLILVPQGASLSDYVFPDPMDFSTLSTGDFMTCFAKGTLIATPQGEIPVEDLVIGGEVLNSAGLATPIKWIGRQTVYPYFVQEKARLIRMNAGSLGDGLPHSDLTVTADHAMLVDGVLCNASALLNGVSITQISKQDLGDSYTVYHIETETHEIILANGAETETYIDHAKRRVFDNYAEYAALYGEEVEMQELPLPRVTTQRALPVHIRHKIGAEQVA